MKINARQGRVVSLAACFAVVASLCGLAHASDREAQTIITNVHVFDGVAEDRIENAIVLIEGNLITDIRSVGAPGTPIDESGRPKAAEGATELDLSGHYVLPGFVDLHGHLGGSIRETTSEVPVSLRALRRPRELTRLSDPRQR